MSVDWAPTFSDLDRSFLPLQVNHCWLEDKRSLVTNPNSRKTGEQLFHQKLRLGENCMQNFKTVTYSYLEFLCFALVRNPCKSKRETCSNSGLCTAEVRGWLKENKLWHSLKIDHFCSTQCLTSCTRNSHSASNEWINFDNLSPILLWESVWIQEIAVI